MSDNWYLARNNKKMGPYSSGQMNQMAGSRQLVPTDMVLQEGTTKWTSASQVQAFSFSTTAVPLSSSPKQNTVNAVMDNSPHEDIPAASTPSESHYVDRADDKREVTGRPGDFQRARYADIANAIENATADGMYPLIAFGLDKDNRPGQALLVTSSIPDMVLAWDMLDRFLPQDYAFSGYVTWNRLETFADSHRMIVRKHLIDIPNFVATRDADFFINLARDHSASRWHQKAFGLVDICGFSKNTIEQQLAYRTSLALALSQASARVHKLHEAEFLPGAAPFIAPRRVMASTSGIVGPVPGTT